MNTKIIFEYRNNKNKTSPIFKMSSQQEENLFDNIGDSGISADLESAENKNGLFLTFKYIENDQEAINYITEIKQISGCNNVPDFNKWI